MQARHAQEQIAPPPRTATNGYSRTCCCGGRRRRLLRRQLLAPGAARKRRTSNRGFSTEEHFWTLVIFSSWQKNHRAHHRLAFQLRSRPCRKCRHCPANHPFPMSRYESPTGRLMTLTRPSRPISPSPRPNRRLSAEHIASKPVPRGVPADCILWGRGASQAGRAVERLGAHFWACASSVSLPTRGIAMHPFLTENRRRPSHAAGHRRLPFLLGSCGQDRYLCSHGSSRRVQ